MADGLSDKRAFGSTIWERPDLVSIKDVAAYAGVSDKTVSRVVNREASVKAATREKVEDAIKELGYVPNQAARLMRSNRSGVVGIMTDVVARTANSVELIGGIQDRLSEAGKGVLIANTGGTEDGEQAVWRTFQEHRLDGVLYATMFHQHVTLAVEPPPLPTVLVNCSAPDKPDLPSVVPDDFEGGYVAARYLAQEGHKRIAYITLNPQIVAAKLRGAAFQQALEEAGVPINGDWILAGYEGPVGAETMRAFRVASELLALPDDERPTAIMCGNDEIALQVISAAHAARVTVPDDVAVVGFDDFKMISTNVVPNLTTVGLPYYDIGKRAADKLLRLLAGETIEIRSDKMACPLVVRDSA